MLAISRNPTYNITIDLIHPQVLRKDKIIIEVSQSKYKLRGLKEMRNNPLNLKKHALYVQEKKMKKLRFELSVSNGSNIVLTGSNVVDAIENGFRYIAKTCRLGNAAGYTLERVTAEYSSSILGGEGGVVVNIIYKNAQLVGFDKPTSKHSSCAWIYAKQSDLPKLHTFEIK